MKQNKETEQIGKKKWSEYRKKQSGKSRHGLTTARAYRPHEIATPISSELPK